MQRTIISKLISGLNASGGAAASVSGGSGITVNNGVVAVDNNVVATDTELATQLATKISASDNNLDFTGTNPKFSNALTVQNGSSVRGRASWQASSTRLATAAACQLELLDESQRAAMASAQARARHRAARGAPCIACW